MKVLLVEDEFLVRLLMAEALTAAGYSVAEASSGEEGICILEKARNLEILVTDVQMPGPFDGIAVARRARALWPGMPIVFATARPDTIRVFTERIERDAVVQKPYGPDQLLEVIGRCLGPAAAG